MTVTDAEAAAAWAHHRGLDLDTMRELKFGAVALILAIWEKHDVRAQPIPQYVVRTIADLERAAQLEETP